MLRDVAEIRIREASSPMPICERCKEPTTPETLDEVDLFDHGKKAIFHKKCFQEECAEMFTPRPK